MDNESKSVVAMLAAIADVNRRIGELALRARSRPEVNGVSHGLECRKYDTGTRVEGHVDIELVSGRALCFWLDVAWDDARWVVDSRVSLIRSGEQDTMFEFPERYAASLPECLKAMADASAELFSSPDFFD